MRWKQVQYGSFVFMSASRTAIIAVMAALAFPAGYGIAQGAGSSPQPHAAVTPGAPNNPACAARYQQCMSVCAQRASQCAAQGGTNTLCDGIYNTCATSCRVLAIGCR
jgi:hypothetical protein